MNQDHRTVWLVYRNGKTKPLPRRKRPHMALYPHRPVKRRQKRSRRLTWQEREARTALLLVAAVVLLIIFLV
jgi:hypothetical protein